MKAAAFWLAACIVAVSNPASHAGDWPQWRGPSRNGKSGEKISSNFPADGPKVVWSAKVGIGFSGISVAQGRAFTMGNSSNEDSVCCFDARTGKRLWQHSYPAQLSPQWYEGGPGATPTVDGNYAFTISKWGDVFCFEAATGAIVWQRDLRQDGIKPNRWGFAGSPLVWRDLLILNAGGCGTALDRKTGQVVWSNGTNATGYASPTLFRSGKYESVLIFAAQHLVALDPRTGAERWRYAWKTDWDTNNSDPIVYDDSVFLSSFSHGCSLISVKNGNPQPLYESKVICNNLSPGVLLGRYYYVFSGEAKKDTELRCLDLLTGELKSTTKEPSFGSLLCTVGKLLVLTEKGELLVFATDAVAQGDGSPAGQRLSAEPIARAKVLSGTCWTPPSLANGLLYARNAKGEVRCLSLR
jgi:outer membrane protein assembly factor BamB